VRRSEDKFQVDAIYHGPGFQLSDFRGYMNAFLANAHTMIDANTLDLRFGVSLQAKEGIDDIAVFGKAYVENLTMGFMEDVEIWENKVFRDVPLPLRERRSDHEAPQVVPPVLPAPRVSQRP
jgi:hypothetical protein